jgi:hypothetical protein
MEFDETRLEVYFCMLQNWLIWVYHWHAIVTALIVQHFQYIRVAFLQD